MAGGSAKPDRGCHVPAEVPHTAAVRAVSAGRGARGAHKGEGFGARAEMRRMREKGVGVGQRAVAVACGRRQGR